LKQRPRVERNPDGGLRICDIAIVGIQQACDIQIKGGRVLAIEPTINSPTFLCLPPLADLHVHASRAFSLIGGAPRSFAHAVELTNAAFSDATTADCATYASQFFSQAAKYGVQTVRTHADLDASIGLNSLRGAIAAADHYRDILRVEIVAFASGRLDPAEPSGKALLRAAIEEGAGFIGGVPALNAAPAVALTALLNLAAERDLPIDLHLDEHLDPTLSLSGQLASEVIERGLQGRVWLSHGCAIGTLEHSERARVIDRLAQAEVTVICLPATNLYLQEREKNEPRQRGLAPLDELLAGGVSVRIASDNVRDAFYPYGRGDILDAAMLAVTASGFEDPRALTAAICNGHVEPRVGDAANFTLISGANIHEVIALRPEARFRVVGDSVVDAVSNLALL
jgi:cytosine/creatinine deaminase